MVQMVVDKDGNSRTDSGKSIPEQIFGHGKHSTGFGSKQIYHRSCHIGEQKLWRIPDVGIVGRKLPGGFFTDQEYKIDDIIQKAAVIFHTFCQNQRAEGSSSFKLLCFKIHPVSSPAKVHKVCGKDRLERMPEDRFTIGDQLLL